MKYNKLEFKDYFTNYEGLTFRINEVKEKIEFLLQIDKLNETIEFYKSLDNNMKETFNRINCNMGFVSYKLNKKMIEELEKGLKSLYESFIESEAYPFSKNSDHFFVRENNNLIDAITGENSIDFSEDENMFLSDCIKCLYGYNPIDYSKNDIPLIKVLYIKYKNTFNTKEELYKEIKNGIIISKKLDKKGKNIYSKETDTFRNLWKIEHLKNKLEVQQQRILNSDSNYKNLLLFSIRAAFYELELLDGNRVSDILQRLKENEAVNSHQRRKIEYEIEALIKAYYNLTDINFRENSNYFSDDDFIFAKFETTDAEVNTRILKMMKR